ncbi:MAG: M17 family metallopeptidase, partial [Lentisphaeraceae bacterium]|nr:M17 family metallopeptidase [Lentisphaeraceae bacterium]
KAISELQPKVNVIGVIPATENVTGANAYKPGDVITAYNGKTIEIINTDAEGRLILCDALAWTVDKFKPDQIVNIATLTGAVISSLGRGIAAVAGNDDFVCQNLIQAGSEVDERLWQMPLCDVHEELLKSDFADLSNVMDNGEASLVNGSAFLKEFVDGTPWAAIDIGGTAWRHRGASYIKGIGASGFGCRLLSQWALNESA